MAKLLPVEIILRIQIGKSAFGPDDEIQIVGPFTIEESAQFAIRLREYLEGESSRIQAERRGTG